MFRRAISQTFSARRAVCAHFELWSSAR
jgi:hypothetical protein